MGKAKRGHELIGSSLRPDEITILDERVAEMESIRKWANSSIVRLISHRPSPHPITRSGFIRAAIRFALDNREVFEEWLRKERIDKQIQNTN